jgi:hypothetical protein
MTVRRLGPVAVAVLAGLVLAACGTVPTPPATTSPTATAPAVTGEPPLTPPPGGPSASAPAASVAPDVSPAGLSATRLSCGTGDPGFPGAVLDQPANAELAPDAPTEALRGYLHTPDIVAQSWPTTGWRVVERSAASVTWMAPGTGTWWIATFQPVDGGWMFSEGGECHLQIALPDGVGFASWRLDPDRRPAPDTTTIHVLGTEMSCAGGKAPVGRVLAPIVLPTDEAVTIALVVRHVPGGADCEGNPEFVQDVTLPQPLGDRPLFDGSTVPPEPRS